MDIIKHVNVLNMTFTYFYFVYIKLLNIVFHSEQKSRFILLASSLFVEGKNSF